MHKLNVKQHSYLLESHVEKTFYRQQHHVLSTNCWDWGIHHYHVKPASSFIWLIHPHLYLLHYFLINKKKFSASSKQKTILWRCGKFTEMCHFPFSLSNSIYWHLHKNAWMESQPLHKDAIEYRMSADKVHCVVYLCACPLLHIYVCWHASEQMGVIS